MIKGQVKMEKTKQVMEVQKEQIRQFSSYCK
jgi:hypothetical protein